MYMHLPVIYYSALYSPEVNVSIIVISVDVPGDSHTSCSFDGANLIIILSSPSVIESTTSGTSHTLSLLPASKQHFVVVFL